MNEVHNLADFYFSADDIRNAANKNSNKQLNIHQGLVLFIEDLSVSFDGFKALNELNFYLDYGELRCLIGPNGAGKTTMMDVITGKTRPDRGTAYFGQTIDLLKLDEPAIAQLGIGRKFQKPTVFEMHSVTENLAMAMKAPKGVWYSLLTKLKGEEDDKINHVLELVGLKNERRHLAGLLSHGQKQWLEIGMLLMQEPKLLLVDEPVAGMTTQETEKTAELLLSLEGKHSVVVVEHDIEFVRSIARKVTVLHEGHVLAEGKIDDIQNNPKVVEVYLGE